MARVRIEEIEAALVAAGVPFEREFEWHEGWRFVVDGVMIAVGAAAIGTLEERLAEWWADYSATLNRTEASGA